MRFLHLSDLHIGKSMHGFSMIDEQKHAFRQIIGYIKTEKPTAVIISGDVYDRAVPSVEAIGLFDDFITYLAQKNIIVMLISGNHDSPERISYVSRLLSDKRLYFNTSNIVLTDEYGEINFWLMPFVKHDIFPSFEQVDYSKRNILVSHQFYTKAGLNPIRSDSELKPVGGLDSIDVSLIESFDYVALGHLHREQSVGCKHIRYCGSPIKYSFSEWTHKKSITLVEIGEKGDWSYKLLPIIPVHDMKEIRGSFYNLINNKTDSSYLRIVLTDKNEIIDPMGQLRTVYPHIMELAFEHERVSDISANIESIESLSPYELFCEFFLKIHGFNMNSEQASIIRDLLEVQ